jgi:hypothetical protein
MEKKKEKYEKPVLRTIELLAEEVLGTGCYKPLSGHNAGSFVVGCGVGTCSVSGTS